MFVLTASSVLLRGRALALGVAALGVGACGGSSPVSEDSDSGAPATTTAPADTTGDEGSEPTTSGSTGVPEAEPPKDPFQLDRSNVKLLPFRVRFKRLQQLSGLPADDPAFAVLLARRYELGDYDYASGVNPDLTWNASRISVWISGVLPVCRSQAMMSRYPTFPEDLAALLTDAYGIAADADKLADYEVLLGDATLDEATRHDTICVAALSALEFVAQ